VKVYLLMEVFQTRVCEEHCVFAFLISVDDVVRSLDEIGFEHFP
jgi:hypothetical protein